MHEYPAFFTKATRSVIGPYDAIPYDPAITKQLDWETELALVIGVGGTNIKQAAARSHIFGYTVLNDISARDLQRRHGGQFMKGKSLDGTCPMGPWIVTADEIDPDNLRLLTRVNGVTKQDSNTSKLHFKIERLIEELSLGMTLESGDVLATGTPAGVGWPRNPPEFLQAGDILESELVGIGCLRNQVTPVP
jgi:2-keto-4-pentenoate hydratase/2-oxohepta-3-ene-1,7-dioic acid hydratase in catechol pathway